MTNRRAMKTYEPIGKSQWKTRKTKENSGKPGKMKGKPLQTKIKKNPQTQKNNSPNNFLPQIGANMWNDMDEVYGFTHNILQSISSLSLCLQGLQRQLPPGWEMRKSRWEPRQILQLFLGQIEQTKLKRLKKTTLTNQD